MSEELVFEDVKLLEDIVIAASNVLIIGEELNVESCSVDDEVFVIALSVEYETVSNSLDILIDVLVFVQLAEGSIVV